MDQRDKQASHGVLHQYKILDQHDHKPGPICDSKKYKLPWDFKIQTDQRMDHNKPDTVLLNKGERSCLIIDVTCSFDTRVLSKENEKIENYHDLKHEIKRGIWNYRSVQVIPIVIGALGTVTRGFGNWLRHLGMLYSMKLL